LVFHSSTIAMMHGPINIRFTKHSIDDQLSMERCWKDIDGETLKY